MTSNNTKSEKHDITFIVILMVSFLSRVSDSMMTVSSKLFLYQSTCLLIAPDARICKNISNYPEIENMVQIKAAVYLRNFRMAVFIPALLLSCVCGTWSDRVGRKPILLIGPVGTILAILCNMTAYLYQGEYLCIYWIIFGSFVQGMLGRAMIFTIGLQSFVADISTPDSRTKRFSKLLAAKFLGCSSGSLIVGSLLGLEIELNIVFCVAAVIKCSCVILIVFFMNEKLPRETHKARGKSIASKTDLQAIFSTDNKEPGSRLSLIIFCVTMITHGLCKSGESDVLVLFVQRSPLSWHDSFYGYMVATDYAALGIFLIFLLPLLTRFLKFTDLALVIMAFMFRILRLLLLAFSVNTWMVFLAVLVGSPNSMIISVTKSLISKLVDNNQLGKVLGTLSSAELLADLIGSVLFTTLYGVTAEKFAGSVFIVSLLMRAIIVIPLCVLYFKSVKK